MLKYIHFALSNVYLVNGYEEQTRPGGTSERRYSELENLETCVARLVVRQPKRLRGWDFRFLRNQLGLSQREAGKLLDRDAQTVARWEKSKRKVPSFADLVIRTRFAARFDPELSLRDVLSFVDGTAAKLPDRIFLRFFGGHWFFQLKATVVVEAASSKEIVVRWPEVALAPHSVWQGVSVASTTGAYGEAGRGAAFGGGLIGLQSEGGSLIEIGRTSATGIANERRH